MKKVHTCEPDNKKSFTVKTEKQEPCGFSYVVVRSDGKTRGPYTYRGEDAVFVFLSWLQNHEKEMRKDMAYNRPLVMTNEDWQKYRNAAECHICNKSLFKGLYLDSMEVFDPDSGKYCGQGHRKCYHKAAKNRYAPREIRKPKDYMDQWIKINQETCLFCADPLIVPNFKDSVKDHDHMTGKYCGAAHNECNFKLKLNPKTTPIPVIFHNLKGYDGHLLMQAMARVQGEIKCIATNTEKYISFSLGNLRFIDSINFLLSSLEELVKGSDEFPIMKKLMPEENKRQLLLKKGVYLYEYMDSFERFGETKLPDKEKFYSSLSGKGITYEEYERAKQVWETFGCRNLGNYHDLYVATDTLLLAYEAKSKDCICKLTGKPWQPRQSFLRSKAQLLCNGWQCQQQSTHICKSFFREGACHEVKKEGLPGGPSWETPHQISSEECVEEQEDRSARRPACIATVWKHFQALSLPLLIF